LGDGEESMSTDKPDWLRWWERVIAKRFGYFMAISLLAWPLLTTIPALQSILRNVMLLDTYPRLFFFTFNNVIAFFFTTAILRVLYSRHPSDSWLSRAIGDGASSWGRSRVWGVTIVALVTPILLATVFGSEFENPGESFPMALPTPCWTILCVTLSAVAAVVFLWLLGHLKSFLIGNRKDAENFFPFEAVDCKGFTTLSRLIDTIDRKLKAWNLSSTDVQLGVYLLMLAVSHRLVLPLIEDDRYHLSSAPTAIVLLLWVSGMVLTGLAQLLDRLRIPIFVSGVFILTVIFAFVGSTRPFRSVSGRLTTTQSQASNALLNASEDLPWQAIKNRLDCLDRIAGSGPDRKSKTLVIVTCPGGGIHAAAWSACVLDKLCDEYEGFQESLCVISSVSGGSVGSLMFVGSRYQQEWNDANQTTSKTPSKNQVIKMLNAESPALELATRSSLESISFGATVDDLYGLFGLPRLDRGERLERDISNRLSTSLREKTLGNWGQKALDGLVPILVFNATDAVTGRRVLFDSIPTPTPTQDPNRNSKAKPIHYRELLADDDMGADVLPATAARISATFPYVTPFTKPYRASLVGQQVALGDGGYADNEGIVTAVNWINYIQKKSKEDLGSGNPRPFDRILLLRIEPALSVENDEQKSKTDPFSYIRWLIGPLETMINVRSSSQLERGNLESDLIGDPTTPSYQNKDNKERIDMPAIDTSLPIEQLKKEWNSELEKMVERSKETNWTRKPVGQSSSSHAPKGKTPDEPKVIVESIRFYDADQEIPLSWKLSKIQKLWYLVSWEKLDRFNPNLRETLDSCFTRK
jgi:hypothetical protein